jgi:hypothetical protein
MTITPDQVWKAPVTAREVSDRLKAQAMAALPVREIPAATLEEYWREWESLCTAPDGDARNFFPPVLQDEIGWLQRGEGLLRLPDGTRWVFASARLPGEHTPHDNMFLRRLHALLLEHRGLRRPHGSARTAIMLEADTLDVHRVFCTDCRAWCDLQADAEEADRTLGPWPGGGEWRRPPRGTGG